MKTIGRPFLITLLVFVITLMGFVYYYSQASAAISTANNAIATLDGQVAILQSQLSSASSQVSSLQAQLSSSKSQLAAAQNQLSQANSQVSTLQRDIDSYKSQVASLQGDISSYKTQVASLQVKLVAAGSANITDLQNQVSTLQAQNQDLADIVNLARVSVKVDTAAVTHSFPTHPYDVVTFGAPYAGYLIIAGQGSSPDAFITVTDSYPGYPFNDYRYQFGTGATLTIPVLPGNITVYYNNTNQGAVSTATISVRYYY